MSLCYKDKTFCSAYGISCKNQACHRALTPAISLGAEKWWDGPDAPICVSNFFEVCAIVIPITKD